MSKRERHVCAECIEEAYVRVEGDTWLCWKHINERVNEPGNVAQREQDDAAEDMADFRRGGGQLS
jgi:ribosomal protein L37AE/L43A